MEIALSWSVFKINVFLHFTQEFKMAAKNWQENDSWEKSAVDSANTLWVKKFVKITLSRTVSEINAFLHFTQKYKMAAKNGGETTLVKSRQ